MTLSRLSWLSLALWGCSSAEAPRDQPASAAASAPAQAPAPEPATSVKPKAPAKESCPAGMLEVPGGTIRIGSAKPGSAPEEEPAFDTKIATFCLDATELTTAEYQRCVDQKKCEPAHDDRRFCNARRVAERADHPINCVDWKQAKAVCEARGARLPSEAEWEYAARGGSENRPFSWGKEAPDGRTCWKHVGGTCKVKEFAAGAFGLYDVSGNVNEWTEDWFGEYPWPAASGMTKIYRGGSWSRRFPKWLSPRLRNRYRPSQWGSHLGLRCAKTLAVTPCPYGRRPDGKACYHGVEGVSCNGGTRWNGVRCARPGEPECEAGRKRAPGHGCVLESAAIGPFVEGESGPVTRVRSAEFDADCLKNKPGKSHAYKYSGGTHDKRNRVSGRAGCSNRDVGVGWNSTCCP